MAPRRNGVRRGSTALSVRSVVFRAIASILLSTFFDCLHLGWQSEEAAPKRIAKTFTAEQLVYANDVSSQAWRRIHGFRSWSGHGLSNNLGNCVWVSDHLFEAGTHKLRVHRLHCFCVRAIA